MAQDIQDIDRTINDAVEAYFNANPEVNSFPAKKLMPGLISAGLFKKDKKNGMPLRQVLRRLDSNGELEKIVRLHAERVGEDVYWYFVREGATFVSNHVTEAPNAKQRKAIERSNSDEMYLLDLLDEVLKRKGSRKHTFDYLLGDLHKDGKTRTELAIDVFYVKLNLAIEIIEHPSISEKANAEKEEKLTVSGITRAEQRLKYFNRRKSVLTKKDKAFVEVPMERFEVDEKFRLVRNKENDEQIVKELLTDFIR